MKYQEIIDVMLQYQDINGVCNISQKEIAAALGMSQSLVSKCLKRLEHSDFCIRKISSGKYEVLHDNILEYGPYNKIVEYCKAINKNEGLLKLKYKDQSIILGISVHEIKMIKGYLCFKL